MTRSAGFFPRTYPQGESFANVNLRPIRPAQKFAFSIGDFRQMPEFENLRH
jgi:hypothetical protein